MGMRAVKVNRLPSAGLLLTSMLPCMRATSSLEMVSPRPVPPKRRVTESSAWLKGSKMRSQLLRRNADAAVPHHDLEHHFAIFLRLPCNTQADEAAVGELDRIADEVDDDLPEAMRVADQGVGHHRIDLAAELEVLCLRALGNAVDGKLDTPPDAEGDLFEIDLAGLDSREIQNIVDDPPSKASEALRARPRYSRCSAESCESRTRSVMPMMAFIGVRISWLMLARNAFFVRLAASAAWIELSSLRSVSL